MIKFSMNKLVKIYLVLSLLIIGLVEIESSGSVPLKVFHIEQNKGYLLLFLTVMVVIISFLFKTRTKLDIVLLLLIAKCVLDIIPAVSGKVIADSTFWYMYAMVVIMPFIYFIFKKYSGDLNFIINSLSYLALLMVAQMILTVFANGLGFSSGLFKHYLRIPAAHSNIIGVILLSVFVLRIGAKKTKKFDFVINSIIVIGLIISKSRGSWIFLLLWFSFVKLKQAKEEKKDLRIFAICMATIIGIIIFVFFEDLQILLFESTLSELDFTKIGAGRFELWALGLKKWLQSPWLGFGLGVTNYDIGFEIISTGVHNIVIDYLVQSGVIGTLIYGLAIFMVYFKHKKHKSPLKKGVLLAATSILFYSMFEVCYFNFVCLFLFWMLMGIYSSNCN